MVISDRPQKSKKILIGLILSSLVLTTLYFREDDNGWLHNMQRTTIGVMAPFQSFAGSISDSIGESVASVTQVFKLTRENRELKSKIKELQKEKLMVKAVKGENARMSKLLLFKDRLGQKSIAARLIGIGVLGEARIILDKGERDSVKDNLPVVSEKGLVGRVLKASGRASLVALLTDPRSAVGCIIERTGDLAITEGNGGNLLDLKHINADAKVKKGDRVITSGMGGVFPRGILIGRVEKISRGDDQMEPIISVRPAVEAMSLTEALILQTETMEPPGGWKER